MSNSTPQPSVTSQTIARSPRSGGECLALAIKRGIAASLSASMVMIGIVGCTEQKSSIKREVKINTPGGTTTITTEKEVKKTGDNPPPDPTP